MKIWDEFLDGFRLGLFRSFKDYGHRVKMPYNDLKEVTVWGGYPLNGDPGWPKYQHMTNNRICLVPRPTLRAWIEDRQAHYKIVRKINERDILPQYDLLFLRADDALSFKLAFL